MTLLALLALSLAADPVAATGATPAAAPVEVGAPAPAAIAPEPPPAPAPAAAIAPVPAAAAAPAAAAPVAPPPAATAPAPAAGPAAPPATAPAPGPSRRIVLNRVAATVNGEVVTLQELEQRGGEEWRRANLSPPGPERDRAVAQVLRRAFEQVVAEKLFHSQAAALQVEVSDEEVNAAIEDIKKRNNADDKMLDKMLAEQDLTRAVFREQIRGQLESFRVLSAKVRAKVKVTDDDVKNYYQRHPGEFLGEEELHVRHLLVALAEGATPMEVGRAMLAAEKARQRITGGEPFAEVAKAVSGGPNAAEGGDLGWLRRGTMQRSLEEVVFTLKDGEVSALVRAGPGLHLFKVEERRQGGGKTFDLAKEEIRDRLTMEQTQAYREQFLGELKRDAVIDIRIPELKD